jgi:MinD-like ATPase involved in chromosome partitioning or flagellar assembly
MIISIASGKGGTGKTTVATNLAVSVRRSGPTAGL